jgi:hypothetical protein
MVRYRAYAFSGTEKTPVSNTDSMLLTALFPPTADPFTLLLWHFDETSGATLQDASSYHRNGTSLDTSRLTGKFGKALYFTDSAYAYTSAPMDFPGDSLFIEFWLKPKTALGPTTERTGILEMVNGPVMIYYYYGRLIAEFASADNAKHVVFADCAFPPNQWSHVAVVLSAGKITIFVNCVLIGEQPAGFRTKLTADRLDLGRAKVLGEDRFYEGYMDELRIRSVAEEYFR